MTSEIGSTVVEPSRPNGTTIALLTRDAAANYLAVSTRTLDRLVHAGAITAYRIGGHRRFRIEDIDSFIVSRKEQVE